MQSDLKWGLLDLAMHRASTPSVHWCRCFLATPYAPHVRSELGLHWTTRRQQTSGRRWGQDTYAVCVREQESTDSSAIGRSGRFFLFLFRLGSSNTVYCMREKWTRHITAFVQYFFLILRIRGKIVSYVLS
jgi:hypothetical protein